MDPIGVAVVVGVLVAATAFALYRRATDGRMRAVGSSTPLSPETLASADTTAGDPAAVPPAAAGDSGEVLTAEELGAPLGERATLVQFSTAFCQPCRATRTILSEVADMVDGVAHVEIDAESRLDLVRRHKVMRAPTVLVLDPRGAVVRRAVGQPRKADVIAALGQTVPD